MTKRVRVAGLPPEVQRTVDALGKATREMERMAQVAGGAFRRFGAAVAVAAANANKEAAARSWPEPALYRALYDVLYRGL